jgi:hypothetical protein
MDFLATRIVPEPSTASPVGAFCSFGGGAAPGEGAGVWGRASVGPATRNRAAMISLLRIVVPLARPSAYEPTTVSKNTKYVGGYL